MSSCDISRGSTRASPIEIDNSPGSKDSTTITPSNARNTELCTPPRGTPKIKGRPTTLQTFQRDRANSLPSIQDFIIVKRKRPQLSDGSPEHAENRDQKAFKRSTKIPRSPPRENISTDSAAPDLNMDAILEQLRKMGEDNTKQFDNMRNQLAAFNQTHQKNFAEIKDELRKNKEEFAKAHKDLETRIVSLEEKENTRDENVQARLSKLEAGIVSVPREGHEVNRKVEFLERKIEAMEKAEIKNNIIIKGIKADPKNAKGALDDFLASEFGAAGKVIDQRIIPVGGNTMFSVKLDSWETKTDILKKKKQLKGREIFISGELTYKERQIAKQIRDLAKHYREEGSTVKIAYKKLEINGVWHYWDENDETLKKSKHLSQSTAGTAASGPMSSRVSSKN